MNNEPTNWDDAARRSLESIYDLIIDADGPDVTRNLVDKAIDQFYNSGNQNSEAMKLGWAVIGSSAISLSVEWKHPLELEHVAEVLVRKQRDYGHENIRRFGRDGLLMRCHDKVARLKNLYGSDFEPNNESIEDTLLDIVGYSAIGIMWESGTFLLPLKSSEKKS